MAVAVPDANVDSTILEDSEDIMIEVRLNGAGEILQQVEIRKENSNSVFVESDCKNKADANVACNDADVKDDKLNSVENNNAVFDDTKTIAHTSDKSRFKPYVRPKRNHSCNECGAIFSYSTSLLNHMRRHTGEKPYKCQVCHRAFPYATSLKNHMITHTREMKYGCAYCERFFLHEASLKTHMRKHTGEKPYTCQYCEKAFAHATSLKNHERIHTGEQPYKCEVCSLKFKHATSLKNHMRTHTGEKPYECKICNRKFAYATSLKNHMKSHKEVGGSRNTVKNTAIYIVPPQNFENISYDEEEIPTVIPMDPEPLAHLEESEISNDGATNRDSVSGTFE